MFAMIFTITFFIGIVILLRCICKNFISARLQYAIWFLVAVKLLVFPMPGIEGNFSVLSLAPAAQSESLSEEELQEAETSGYAEESQQGGLPAEGNLWGTDSQTASDETPAGTDTADGSGEYIKTNKKRSPAPKIRWNRIQLRLKHYMENTLKAPVWLILILGTGSIVCALFMTIYHLRLRSYLKNNRSALTEKIRKTAAAPKEIDTGKAAGPRKKLLPTYSVEGLPTPCLLGKSIYVPAGLSEDEKLLPYVLKHEMYHYAHGDHIWGFVRMACVCLYWYHPLVWLAAYLSRQDCELACDEAVVNRMGDTDRKYYGELLLELAPVKNSPADCFLATTAMSGSARNLKQRLRRITGKNKNRAVFGIFAAAAVLLGIYACITNGAVSIDRQWQSVGIREQEDSLPLRGSYEISYKLSRDAASYGIYIEEYEYGDRISSEVLECAPLRPEGVSERAVNKGTLIFSRTMETDETTGAFLKAAVSYSVQDYTALDGAGSLFKAFTLELPENCIGNSFSANAEESSHRFKMNEDVILLADYYGDAAGLSVPPGEMLFSEEEYREKAETALESDRYVILTHLIVSDKTAEELESQLEKMIGTQENSAKAGNVNGYSNAELLEMAAGYYRQEYGFTPEHVEIDNENGNLVTIWLYDMNEFLNAENEISGSANTRDWYTVDRTTGKGENVLFEEIDLTRAKSMSRSWEGNPDEMTVVDVREPEAFFALPAEPEAGAQEKIYLLGETAHYRLYGAGDYQTIILAEGDSYTEISTPFIMDGITMTAPEIQEADYDGDGEAELAFKMLWGEGTGTWVEKLWILDKEAGQVKAYEYHSGDYAAELLRKLSWYQDGSDKRILLNGQPVSPILKERYGISYEDMSINTSRVSFAFQDGKILLRTLIACGSREASVEPAYGDACLEAEAVYTGNGTFHMEDVQSADKNDMKETAREAVREFYAPREIEIVNNVYRQETWTFSDDEGERIEMILTVLENGTDSYDYAAVPLIRDETGQWSVDGEIIIEK